MLNTATIIMGGASIFALGVTTGVMLNTYFTRQTPDEYYGFEDDIMEDPDILETVKIDNTTYEEEESENTTCEEEESENTTYEELITEYTNPLSEGSEISEDNYQITKDEFFEDFADWDKVSLTFYAGDDTLCDELNQIIDNPEDYLGASIFDELCKETVGKKIFYVTNARLSTLFEVMRMEDSYLESVCGINDEAPNKNKKMRDADDW